MIRQLAWASVAWLSVCGAASAELPAAPAGWVRPTDADLQGVDWKARQPMPGKAIRIEADLNGDGKPDAAELLIHRRSQTYGLFAFIDGARAPEQLLTSRLEFLERVGIAVTPPGRYDTACSKGLDRADPQCERGPKTIDTKHAAIRYFLFDATSDNLYWDGSKFIQVWSRE